MGLIAGAGWGWGVISAGLLGLLLHHVAHAAALTRWLRSPSDQVPLGRGAWENTFAGLYRLVRANGRQQYRLSAMLARYNRAGRAMPDGIVVLDSHHRIEWCNPTAEHYLGLDTNRDTGQAIFNLVRQPDFVAYLESGKYHEPLMLRMSRGQGLVLSLRIVPYGQDHKLLLWRDVTHAERIETMRRDFVANVSHELRTPLTVVNGFLETFADGALSMDEPRAREILAMMQEQTGRMRRLVEDLLTLSALESSASPADEAEVDVAALFAALRAEGEALSGGRHRVTAHPGAPATLLGSEKELHSAFGNLVSNAVRYTPAGGEIRLTFHAKDDGGGVFSVSDSGIGFEARHIPRLTERFYRVDSSRSRETGGTGLGLAIVKHVLTRHQGSLDIESEVGRGSRFSAVFPARRVRWGATPKARAIASNPPRSPLAGETSTISP